MEMKSKSLSEMIFNNLSKQKAILNLFTQFQALPLKVLQVFKSLMIKAMVGDKKKSMHTQENMIK